MIKYIPLLALHVFQVALSLNAAYHSYHAITALRPFEGVAKKAAKVSKEAAEQLRRTRSTETAGAAAIALSLLSSLFVTIFPTPGWVKLCLNIVLIGALMAARVHMLNFWEKQRAIPVIASAYNKGLDRSENVTDRLSWLEISWLVSTLVTAWYVRPYAGRI